VLAFELRATTWQPRAASCEPRAGATSHKLRATANKSRVCQHLAARSSRLTNLCLPQLCHPERSEAPAERSRRTPGGSTSRLSGASTAAQLISPVRVLHGGKIPEFVSLQVGEGSFDSAQDDRSGEGQCDGDNVPCSFESAILRVRSHAQHEQNTPARALAIRGGKRPTPAFFRKCGAAQTIRHKPMVLPRRMQLGSAGADPG
jgi:hypothetical protein